MARGVGHGGCDADVEQPRLSTASIFAKPALRRRGSATRKLSYEPHRPWHPARERNGNTI